MSAIIPPTQMPVERVKVIKFSHVSKKFALHTQRVNSFQEMLTGLFGRGRRLVKPPPELAAGAREFWALRDVNFSVYTGEALGIIGENGSGKSTTLKLISRILYPTEGSVSVDPRRHLLFANTTWMPMIVQLIARGTPAASQADAAVGTSASRPPSSSSTLSVRIVLPDASTRRGGAPSG